MNFTVRELQIPVFLGGELIYTMPAIEDIRSYVQEELQTMPEEILRLVNPHIYIIDLSQELWDLKVALLSAQNRV